MAENTTAFYRRDWRRYPDTYRQAAVDVVAGWIKHGESGTVAGLPGAGKSNFLNYICYRSEVFDRYWQAEDPPVSLVAVDLNSMVDKSIATFYRLILRALFYSRSTLPAALQSQIERIYEENKRENDPFLCQTALFEFLMACEKQQHRLVLVFDRFDYFCRQASPAMTHTLRALRDHFKGKLTFIMGMRHEVVYQQSQEVLGELHELLDTNICWLGQMSETDAIQIIQREAFGPHQPQAEKEMAALLELSGRFPALLRVLCHWWKHQTIRPPIDQWKTALFNNPTVRHRLTEMWSGLNQEERFILAQINQGITTPLFNRPDYQNLKQQLAAKGVCRHRKDGWVVEGQLLRHYVTLVHDQILGRIWLDDNSGEIYQGQTVLTHLTPLERAVLTFFLKYPRIRHAKSDIIAAAWPDDAQQVGVGDSSLHQIISGLRKKIELAPGQPAYLIGYRGLPESGYQFFPEGRPY